MEVVLGNADEHILSDYWMSSSFNSIEVPVGIEYSTADRFIVSDESDMTFISHPPPDLLFHKIYLVCEKFLI